MNAHAAASQRLESYYIVFYETASQLTAIPSAQNIIGMDAVEDTRLN